MIDRTRLRELHGSDLPLHILEQDYVQALFLQELYRRGSDLIFKGGTFLKHAHGLDRFSEDIDFTQVTDGDVPSLLSETANELTRYGLDAEIDAVERETHTVVCRLRYRGPLYDGSDRSLGSVELDVSTRNDVLEETEWRRLFFPYPETRAVTANCLSVEEALAEKLRALSTRTRGRDLYDCWFLLESGVAINPAHFEEKMAAIGREPRLSVTITGEEWQRDLSVLVEHPPAYEAVLESLTAAVADAGLPIETP